MSMYWFNYLLLGFLIGVCIIYRVTIFGSVEQTQSIQISKDQPNQHSSFGYPKIYTLNSQTRRLGKRNRHQTTPPSTNPLREEIESIPICFLKPKQIVCSTSPIFYVVFYLFI